MKTSPAQPDAIRCPRPDSTQMNGLVGQRHSSSRLNRLHKQEDDHLLFPFHQHYPVGWMVPGRPRPEIRGDWQGEYIGTWLDAAILSAWNAGDAELHTKIDGMVEDLLSTQQEDGYLGTYDEVDRWKSWDLWVQAHDLIGLLSYYNYTGAKKALDACIKIADRVLQDFGPGLRGVHQTGPRTHGYPGDYGMASSSFLEPLIWLYWKTGDQRYLDWGKWLVDEDWEAPDGPRIVSSLMAGRGVAGTANAKGIEMLICFAGMIELFRATGDRHYLDPVLVAWKDIVEHHLYLTGTASTGEFFTADYLLRNDGSFRLGETCVSMGWLYLNLSLGRLLGEARFFDMAEQTLYNHLLAAQSPDGHGWAYYVGLRDSKRYRWHTDPECCPTRGVRALAVIPQHVFCQDDKGIYVNFYEPAKAKLTLGSGVSLKIELVGNYPFDGDIHLKLELERPVEFGLYLRLAGWCKGWRLSLNGAEIEAKVDANGYLEIQRLWNSGDTVRLDFDMPVQIVVDSIGNNGRVALSRGPLVYAADSSFLPAGSVLDDVILKLDANALTKNIKVISDEQSKFAHLVIPRVVVTPSLGTPLWQEKERYYNLAASEVTKVIEDLELVPFFDAGNRDPKNFRDGVLPNDEPVTNITYQVWLPFLS